MLDDYFNKTMPTYSSNKSAFDFSDGYGADPIQRRYGVSQRDIDRALREKQTQLELRAKESEVVAREVSINSALSKQNYENRLRAETEAQLSDAYQALGQAATADDYATIVKRYPNALRDDAFKSALDTSYQTAQKQHEYVLKAAEVGALRQFDQLSQTGTPAPRALAEAVTRKRDQDLVSELAVRGVDVPREEDGSLDPEVASMAQAKRESEKLMPEERQFVLDKWRQLQRQITDPLTEWESDEAKQSALSQMQDLETFLNPMNRLSRPNNGQATQPTTIPTDNYFQL